MTQDEIRDLPLTELLRRINAGVQESALPYPLIEELARRAAQGEALNRAVNAAMPVFESCRDFLNTAVPAMQTMETR